ncbi:hypothetical protein FAES_4019 [Fibrella aestuarina BUZ 2]|uniref:Uncharacterized protein n=1 Tax=Fibrella aestuarina BUZ 2 TaxID=1166018 RepID=I0KD16_9BACT|nr:hypothetical protein [Fibrella aestuarina]CCH02019.1 hypothetical protein FAES_4019 [Fibrella aestuarina BUZ 2]
MEQTPPKRFRMPSAWIGAIEVVNAVLLTLTGYTIGQHESWLAIGVALLYAAGKNIVERAEPL